MQAYRIVDWKIRYEVTDKSAEAKANTPIENLRKGPLRFVRSRVWGHVLGPAYRLLMKKAFRHGYGIDLATFGLFQKLLELAADQEREYRGWILDHKQQPIDAEQIQQLLMTGDIDVVKRCMELLCDPEIGWLELSDFPDNSHKILECPSRESGKPQSLTGRGAGKPQSLSPETTETETVTQHNTTETETGKTSASDFSPDVSDSVSDAQRRLAIREARAATVKRIVQILQVSPGNQSDITTFQHIFDQVEKRIIDGELTVKIFDVMIETAIDCRRYGNGRIGAFVNAMKEERFGYMPVRKRVIGSRFSKY